MTNRKEKDRNIYCSLLRGVLITLLTYAPALLGTGIILSSKGPLTGPVLSLGAFLIGFSGVIIIVRKESPSSIRPVRGKWAVIQGIIFTVLFWGFALFFLIFGLE